MKNSADLGGCYPPRPSASVDNTLLDLQNSSYPPQPHSIIANNYLSNYTKYKYCYSNISVRHLCKGPMLTMVPKKSSKYARGIAF